MWVYTEFRTLNQNCGLCINEADMTEITEFRNIAQYPEDLQEHERYIHSCLLVAIDLL